MARVAPTPGGGGPRHVVQRGWRRVVPLHRRGPRDRRGPRVAVQPDSKIVIAGTSGVSSNNSEQVALVRLHPNGAPDSTFGGGDGMVNFPVHAPSDVDVNAVVIQPDGKIVVAGGYSPGPPGSSGTTDWLVARFNADGSIDETFGGGDGSVTIDAGWNFSDTLYSVALQPDGKIVAAGRATQSTTNFGVIRLRADGTPDATFDGDGVAVTDFFGSHDGAYDVIVEPDGKIVAVGEAFVPATGYRRFALARYNANGSPDTSFDGDGKAWTDFGIEARAREVARRTDGTYVVGGLVAAPAPTTTFGYTVARYLPGGALDASFGDNAALPGTTVLNSMRANPNASLGLVLQADGKIVLGGGSADGQFDFFMGVARFNENGSRDTSFYNFGYARYLLPGSSFGDTNGQDVALTPAGKIVVVGSAPVGGSLADFAVIQVQSDFDGTPPAALEARFLFERRQSIEVRFSENVTPSVQPGDVTVRHLGNGQTFNASSVLITSTTGLPTRAEWVFATTTPLPDGLYRATLPAADVTDAFGNPLPADVTVEFHVLAGDANRDRRVNLQDFNVLAANFGQTNKTFSQGDFNYDGLVNLADFNLLAARFGIVVAPPENAAGSLAHGPSIGHAIRPGENDKDDDDDDDNFGELLA